MASMWLIAASSADFPAMFDIETVETPNWLMLMLVVYGCIISIISFISQKIPQIEWANALVPPTPISGLSGGERAKRPGIPLWNSSAIVEHSVAGSAALPPKRGLQNIRIPKSSILIEVSSINQPALGVPPLLWNLHLKALIGRDLAGSSVTKQGERINLSLSEWVPLQEWCYKVAPPSYKLVGKPN